MIYLDHLLAATSGQLYVTTNTTVFDAFNHDTRQLIPGQLFVAVRGERGNGHDYLLDAVQRGARGLLVEAQSFNALASETREALTNVPIILVEDTRIALQQYARAILQRWQPTVIAVTGSTGKTSTKEAIATILSSHFPTFRSWQNYNDLLGLPLSLGRLEPRHEYAVVELGCDHPGEIAALCHIARPRIGVLTNISPAHLKYFGSLNQFAHELCTLLATLPEDGTAIYNQDDVLIQDYLKTQSIRARHRPFSPTRVQHVQVTWEGLHCTLPAEENIGNTGNAEKVAQAVQLSSHLLGAHHISTMLAAYTVAYHCGMEAAAISAALSNVYPMPGRMKPLEGRLQSRLLDDTHNAAPAAVLAGLEALHTLPAGMRIAILGDMLDLGNYETEAHQIVGRVAAHSADYLITRGDRASIIAEAARHAGMPAEHIIETATYADAANVALGLLAKQTQTEQAEQSYTGQPQGASLPYTERAVPKYAILIKGSEATRMERVTELLMAKQELAREELVRQTPGWKQIVVMRPERPTWLEIDLSAIGNNTRLIKALVGPHVRLLISLKADAYGHGAIKVARTTLHNGASMLGVATVSEATPLREAGISAPILVFGYVPLWQMREAVRQQVTVTLYSLEAAQALSRAAVALNKTVNVHVKIDTGMGRLGLRSEQHEEIVALIRAIKALPGLVLEGLYTHFAQADAADKSYTYRQLERLHAVLDILEAQGLRPPIVHAANSAATLALPETHFDMVRPGIAIYGLHPSDEVRLPESFRPALSFKTQVAQVKIIPAGEGIGYGSTYITDKPTRIAVLPVGYADGFRRAPRNWGSVLIHGQEAPLLGRVCMDQCMVDVSHIPQTRVGDEVVLIGRQGNATLTAEQVAERLGTINYEVVAEILARVPRVD
jgi:alanine racemase